MQKLLKLREQLVNHDKKVKTLGYVEINQLLTQLIEFFEGSAKSTVKTYFYNNQTDQITAQSIMIELGNHCLEFCDWVD